MSGGPLLQIDDVRLSFAGVRALDGVSLAVGAALVLLVVPVFYSGSFEQWVESTNRTVWASVSRTVFPRWIVGIEPFALQVSKSWAHLQKSHTLIFHLNPLWLWVPTLFVAAWGAWRFKSLARLMCFGILCTAAIFPILLFLTAYRRPDYIYSFYSVYFIPPVAVSFAAVATAFASSIAFLASSIAFLAFIANGA